MCTTYILFQSHYLCQNKQDEIIPLSSFSTEYCNTEVVKAKKE